MLVLWTLLLCTMAASELSHTADVNQREILKDVKTIRVTGKGCSLTIFGADAFPLAAGITKSENFHAMGAAGSSPFHNGRIAGFTLTDFLVPEDPAQVSGDPSQKNRFLENLFRWLGGNKPPGKFLVVGGNDALVDFLAKQKMDPSVLKMSSLLDSSLLTDVDVIVIKEYITPDHVPVLKTFLENGGGIAIAIDTCSLLRTLKVPGDFAINFPPNMLSKHFGFVWRDYKGESIVRAPKPGGIFNMNSTELESTMFTSVWKEAKTAFLKPSVGAKDLEYGHSLKSHLRTMPRDVIIHDPYIYPEALNFIRVVTQPIPRESNPVFTYSDKLKLLLFDYITAYVLMPEHVVAHPSSAYFPGKTAGSFGEGQTFQRTFNLDKEEGGWYSTGLYAPPGQIVTVKLDEYSSEKIPLIYLLVGCHSDEEPGHSRWLRPSMVQRYVNFENDTAVFNSPYGGSIYVVSQEPPEDDPCVLIQLNFERVIPAPYFKLRTTTVKKWQEVNRLAPAPWAELATDKVILSVKSDDIRDLDDPISLMRLWDELVDKSVKETAARNLILNPIRLVADVQPGCKKCSMHSGYPLVSDIQYSRRATTLNLRQSWGFWQEQSSIFQDSLQNLTSTGDNSCNSIGFYVYSQLCDTELESAAADQDFILNGVNVIQVEEKRGDFITVYGKKAFPLMAAGGWNSAKYPVGAGGRFGKGRMIGFANRDVLWPADAQAVPPGATDLDQLLMNMFQWLSGDKPPKHIALIDGHSKMAAFLEKNGIKSTKISFSELKTYENLEVFDVVIVVDFLPEDCVSVLQRYLRNGGGIAMSYTQYKLGNRRLEWGTFADFGEHYPPNRLSKRFGFVWRYVPGEPYSEQNLPDHTYDLSRSYLLNLTVVEQWNQVKTVISSPLSDSREEISAKKDLVKSFILNVRTVPRSEFVKQRDFYIDVLRFVTGPQPLPMEIAPVKVSNEVAWAKIKLFEMFTSVVLKLADVKAHPASDIFPGKVLVPAGFPEQVTRLLSLNKPQQAWIFTGMYAVPGKVLTVTLSEIDAKEASELVLQVGCHPETSDKEFKWLRIPVLIRQASFINGTATVNSPYGGGIYVYSKGGPVMGGKPLKFTFVGAVKAPYFKLGETTMEQWRENRVEPGPWAELATEKVILSVPSEDVVNLDDPDKLLQEWDRAIDAIFDLLGKPKTHPRPERLVADVWHMEEGYPTCFMAQYRQHVVNPSELYSANSWNLWEVFSKNYVDSVALWTFDGRLSRHDLLPGKLIAAFVLNTFGGLPHEKMHTGLAPPYEGHLEDYISRKVPFDYWLMRPSFSLVYYLQLQKAYGWEAYKKTFAAYKGLSEDQKPKDNQAKLDLWVLMFSKTVQVNLYDFHKSWGFPISGSVADQLNQFPTTNMSIRDLL